jgi:AmmeMemoRadiSam system protein A
MRTVVGGAPGKSNPSCLNEEDIIMSDNPAKFEGQLLDIEAHQPTAAQQAAMLAMARQAIVSTLEEGQAHELKPEDEFMVFKAGAFVTLREKPAGDISGPGRLRGCIGHMRPDQPLYRVVPDMAVQAATADPRFQPMTLEELDGVTIEIAILSAMTLVNSRDEIVLGKHGLVLSGEWQRALLLPKSPVIYGWDLDLYLANLHQKAGLPNGYWPDEGKLYTFTSFDFGE